MTQIQRPTGSPGCWGQQFEDGNRECNQCHFRDGCRPVTMNRLIQVGGPKPALPPPPMPQQQMMVPMPPGPFMPAPVQQQAPVYRPTTPSAPPQPVQMVYQQPSAPIPQPQQQWPAPDSYTPNPMAPMARPGAPGPAYYFTQYPGESVPERLTKNVMLRGLEAMFGELTYFFRHWTWPPRQK